MNNKNSTEKNLLHSTILTVSSRGQQTAIHFLRLVRKTFQEVKNSFLPVRPSRLNLFELYDDALSP